MKGKKNNIESKQWGVLMQEIKLSLPLFMHLLQPAKAMFLGKNFVNVRQNENKNFINFIYERCIIRFHMFVFRELEY